MIILNFIIIFVLAQCNENKRKLVGELAVSFQPSAISFCRREIYFARSAGCSAMQRRAMQAWRLQETIIGLFC